MPSDRLYDIWYRSERRVRVSGERVFAYYGCEQLLCLQRATGQLLWKFVAPPGCVLSGSASLSGSLFVACNNGELHALHEKTGAHLWTISYNAGLGVPVVVGLPTKGAPLITAGLLPFSTEEIRVAEIQPISPASKEDIEQSQASLGFWRKLWYNFFGASLYEAASRSSWDQALTRLQQGQGVYEDPYRTAARPEPAREISEARLFLFDHLGVKELSPFDGAVLRRQRFGWESPFVYAKGELLGVLDMSETVFWALEATSWQERWGRSFDMISTRGPLWGLGEAFLLCTERSLKSFSVEDGHQRWRAELMPKELVSNQDDPGRAWVLTDDEQLFLLNASTGESQRLASAPGAQGIAVFGERLFLHLSDSLDALDATTGAILQHLSLPGEARYGLSVSEGQLFFEREEVGSRYLYSLSLREDLSPWKSLIG